MRLLQTINQGRLKDFQTALICHARSKPMLWCKHVYDGAAYGRRACL